MTKFQSICVKDDDFCVIFAIFLESEVVPTDQRETPPEFFSNSKGCFCKISVLLCELLGFTNA